MKAKVVTATVVLLVLLCYLPALQGGFFSDDFAYIVNNQRLQELPFTRIWKILIEPTNPWEFLPMRDLSYRIDLALFGVHPLGFHIHNVLLYGLCCLAVWLFLSSLLPLFRGFSSEPEGRNSRMWICAAATILFALHPAHVESVAWISGRKELLSGLFGLISSWMYVEGIRGADRNWRALAASYVFFVLALLSKVAVIPLVVVAILISGVRFREEGKGMIKRVLIPTWPMIIIAMGFLSLAVMIGKDTGIKTDPFTSEVVRRVTFPQLNLQILGYLTGIALAPFRLRLIYDVTQPGFLASASVIGGFLTATAGTAGFFLAWRSQYLPGFAAWFFLVLCIPFLQLVPFSTWSLASERFLFLPVLGITLIIPYLLRTLHLLWRNAVIFVLAGICLILTLGQTWRWTQWQNLVTDMARYSPAAYYAQTNYIDNILLPDKRFHDARTSANLVRWTLGRETLSRYVETYEAMRKGDWKRAEQLARPLAYLVDPVTQLKAHRLLGVLAERRGDFFEAVRQYYFAKQSSTTERSFEIANQGLDRIRARFQNRMEVLEKYIRAAPDDLGAQGELAGLQMELYLLEEASEGYRNLIRLHPNLAAAHYNLGLTYSRMGRYHQAVLELRTAIDQGIRTSSSWNNLAIAYQRTGNLEFALEAFKTSLRLNPQDCHPRLNLGKLYLVLNQIDQAKKAFQETKSAACTEELKVLADLYLEEVDQASKF